jgi:uncharacterized protein YceK
MSISHLSMAVTFGLVWCAAVLGAHQPEFGLASTYYLATSFWADREGW